MRVLVCSRRDPASANLRDRLLEAGGWQPWEPFRGHPAWGREGAHLVQVDGPAIHDEALDADLRGLEGASAAWFLSKHAAASGQPSLTVHPIGNPGDAKFGGEAGFLPPAAPRDMGALLRRVAHHARAAGLPHQVTLEATHHGPRMGLPSLFVEIGSSEAWYGDPAAGAAVARAVADVLHGEGRIGGPVAVAVGGGHYMPRATDLVLSGSLDVGHMLPAHSLGDGPEALQRAVAATPDCAGIHVHHKGLKGPERQRVLEWAAGLAVPVLNP